jgi:hypothetical protein
MTYTPYYPGGWKDSPLITTPIVAAALQNMEAGITAASPATTLGDLVTAQAGGVMARLGIGGTNQVLTVAGGVPAWANASSGFSNPMTTAGDIIYENATPAAARLAIGSAGQVLTVSGGVPVWAAAPAGSGTVAWKNVKASPYNAVGNGTADDTTALQNAFNDASNAGAGGTVYLPPGVYKVTSTITVKTNTTVIGDGPGSANQGGSVILCGNLSGMSDVLKCAVNAESCTFMNFAIHVNALSGTSYTGSCNGITLMGPNPSFHTLVNVQVYYAGQDGFHFGNSAANVANSSNGLCIQATVDNCVSLGAQRSGFYGDKNSVSGSGLFFDSKINNSNSIQSEAHGFWLNCPGGGTMHLIGCKAYFNGFLNGSASQNSTSDYQAAYGYRIDNNPYGIWLDSCESQNNGQGGFYISSNTQYCAFSNCMSDGDNTSGQTGANGAAFYVNGVSFCKFTNCITRKGSNGPSSFITYGLALFGTQPLTNTGFENCHWEGVTAGVYVDAGVPGTTLSSGNFLMKNCTGFNPVGPLPQYNWSAPAMPTTGTPFTNPTPADAWVTVAASGATISSIAIGGTATGLTSGSFFVPWNQTITVSYTGGTPTWVWFISLWSNTAFPRAVRQAESWAAPTRIRHSRPPASSSPSAPPSPAPPLGWTRRSPTSCASTTT